METRDMPRSEEAGKKTLSAALTVPRSTPDEDLEDYLELWGDDSSVPRQATRQHTLHSQQQYAPVHDLEQLQEQLEHQHLLPHGHLPQQQQQQQQQANPHQGASYQSEPHYQRPRQTANLNQEQQDDPFSEPVFMESSSKKDLSNEELKWYLDVILDDPFLTETDTVESQMDFEIKQEPRCENSKDKSRDASGCPTRERTAPKLEYIETPWNGKAESDWRYKSKSERFGSQQKHSTQRPKRVRSLASSNTEDSLKRVRIETRTAQISDKSNFHAEPNILAFDTASDGKKLRRDSDLSTCSMNSEEQRKGKWDTREEALLTNIVYCFISRELKDIAQVAFTCGINRSTRSIDKKLKRVLGFEKWRERNITTMRKELVQIMIQNSWTALVQSDKDAIQRARTYLQKRGATSFTPLWEDSSNKH